MSNEVHVTQETGDRLVVLREVSVDRQVERTIRDTAAWPTDEQSQRMWALSVVMQAPAIRFKPEDVDEMFVEAQRILDWVNNGQA